MRQKITARTIQAAVRAAQDHGKGVYLWDTELRGFGLWASPKGQGSWLAQKWVGGTSGRPVRLAFDQYPHTTLEDARRKAATLISEIGNGTDIVSRKDRIRKAKAEALQAPTLGETVELYVRKRRQPGRYWAELERITQGSTIAQPLQPATETIAQPLQAQSKPLLKDCARTFSKEEAQQDLRRLREAGSGRYLAARWGRDPATVSRWLAEWQEDGSIARARQGKSVKAIAHASDQLRSPG